MKKQTLIILAVSVIAIAIIWKLFSDSQKRNEISSAVAQDRIENLESNVAQLEEMNIGFHAVQDSLIQRNKTLSKDIDRERKKYAVIALKYEIERSRVKELPDDSAVGLFLDVADCSEVPVMKYDSAYIIPIEPIRFYNDAIVSMDELKEVNQVLKHEAGLKQLLIDSQGQVIISQDQEKKNLNEIINDKDKIIQNKTTQVDAGEKKYRKQVIKTYIAVGVGAVAVVLVAVF